MDLESVIQSEVSQKEKNKYHMLTHIYGICFVLMEISEILFGCYFWNRNNDVPLLIIGRFMFTYESLKNPLEEYAALIEILG